MVRIFYMYNRMRITVKSWNKFTLKSNRGIIMEWICNNISSLKVN